VHPHRRIRSLDAARQTADGENFFMSTGFVTASARSGFALGISTGLVLASAFFLIRPGLPSLAREAAIAPVPASSTAPSTSASMTAAGRSAGSMEAVTLALKTRLAAEGGPDDQWELLAQSYEFLGRSADAGLAREHKVSTTGGLGDAIAASAALLSTTRLPAGAGRAPQAAPDAAGTLVATAERHRQKREFEQACAAYAKAATLGEMTADSWADYADAQASLAGSLAGAPEKAIERALELDPRHAKALWLKASLAHEQHRYTDALATWRQLLAVVQPGSSDARIIEANIAEAARLAKG
jgi:cytochrome c-type biogenesis protein CcmH/NrfG